MSNTDFKRSGQILVTTILLLVWLPPLSQTIRQGDDRQLTIQIRRDFGYGLGSQMQGSFSFRVEGPPDLARVEFVIDEQVIGQDSSAPFRLSFNTRDYEIGIHTMEAFGYTNTGEQLRSNTITRQFVAGRSVSWIVVALVVLVVGFRLISYFLTRQRTRPEGAPAGYGLLGGAVCPHCGRPFGIHWWSLNLMVSRLDRCPHCGKWMTVRRASPDAISAAEVFAQELGRAATETPGEAEDKGEKYRRLLDDSRYEEQ